LGKGLGALIPNRTEKRDYFECALHRIKRAPDQPRRIFDESALVELMESIRVNGLIQPLVVRQDGSEYRLIAGERRFRAAQRLGLESVPVVIKDVAHDAAFELALIENIQRQDLNPVEEAEAYQRLMDLRSYTQEQVAIQLGKSRSAVANTLRLLQLPEAVQERVSSGELSSGAARALLSLPADCVQEAADAALAHQFTVRQIEALARRVKAGATVGEAVSQELAAEGQAVAPPQVDLFAQPAQERAEEEPAAHEEPEEAAPSATEEATLDPEDKLRRRALAKELAQVLGVKANLKSRGQGGTLELSFKDSGELNALVARLLGDQ
jgi:ParB family chromosome partitioning protein